MIVHQDGPGCGEAISDGVATRASFSDSQRCNNGEEERCQ